LDCLEERALLATINASGVISAAAAGPNTSYTITLTNASSSNSGIGTFWFAWVPGEDFLATSPVSVNPPSGWTDNITNMGPGDGFAIQFLANGPANDVKPGSSQNFSFTSADSPAAVNGNSVFFPGTPVETAFVYPQGPFSDAGHQFVVTPASSTSPSPSPSPSPIPTPSPSPSQSPAPPITVVGVQDVTNKKHTVTEVVVDLSGAANSAQANNVATYRLTAANATGSFTARNSPVLGLRSAMFNPANDTITLIPRKAISLARPVELTINGSSPSGLQDGSGQLIDGNGDGVAGGNAVVRISRAGATMNPAAVTPARVVRAAPNKAVGSASPTPPAAISGTSSAEPVGVSSMPPAQPVGMSTMAPAQSVMVAATPPMQPLGIQPMSDALVDDALDRRESMM
jgi:hypothetical protein